MWVEQRNVPPQRPPAGPGPPGPRPPGPHCPPPGPQPSVGQGAAVSVDGILPSETSELYTEDHFAASEVAHGGPQASVFVGAGVTDCEKTGAARATRAIRLNFMMVFLSVKKIGIRWVFCECRFQPCRYCLLR
jgi:hypothetical protein